MDINKELRTAGSARRRSFRTKDSVQPCYVQRVKLRNNGTDLGGYNWCPPTRWHLYWIGNDVGSTYLFRWAGSARLARIQVVGRYPDIEFM